MDNYIKKHFKKIFRNKAIVSLIILLIFAWFLYLNISSGVLDYKTISSSADIEKDMGFNNTKYVKFEKARISFTGYTYQSDGKDKGKYFVVQLEDRIVLALFPMDTPTGLKITDFKGKIRETDSVDKSVISKLYEQNIPRDYTIDNLNYKPSYLIAFYFEVAGAVVALGFVIRYLLLATNPQKHKKFKELEKYGDIDILLENIDRDMESDIRYYDTKTVKITKNHIIETTLFGLNIFKVDEIMWMYKVITRHRTNGIPSGKTYSIEIKFSDPKKRFGISMPNENKTDETLEQLHKYMPNVIYGYSEELFNLYINNFENFKSIWQNTGKENINK